ncbi:MAG: protein kinase [Planctomycetota bacterium]|nr:protein kinase [Planctomycetota bacterium]
MALTADTTLGSYKIESLIGRGGMGEVYLARDTGLDRQVAIKVLPESFAANPERVARFEREARLLATLSHQNIAGIHGLEEQDGMRYLVLELVEGVTLKDHLEKGATPVEETLRICRQIADAVEAAHERGIIHRDLKPANIMITPDDTVKVLDFGIAKALDASGTGTSMAYAATLSADHNTAAGTMVGTPAYMSPEQARGKPIDKRSDIWSFGCVLYECLTGDVAFGGETVTDTLAKILERDPDYTRIPAATPPTIQMLLRRCLQKDRKKRLHDIGDARVQIEEAIADPSGSTLGLSGSYVAISSPRGTKKLLPWLVAVFFAIFAAVALVRPWGANSILSKPVAKTRLAFVASDTDMDWERPQFDLSPDGEAIVFVARPRVPEDAEKPPSQLFVRRLDEFDSKPIPGTERAQAPVFSPSGRWIAFYAMDEASPPRRRLKRVRLDGTPPVTVRDVTGTSYWQPMWLSEDTLLLNGPDKATVTVQNGALEPFELSDEAQFDTALFGVHMVSILPGGRTALGGVFGQIGTESRTDTLFVSLETLTSRVVLEDATEPVYAASGHLLFKRDRSLLAVPFDPSSGRLTGGIMPLISGVGSYDVSETGVLVYHPIAGTVSGRQLVTADINGVVQPLSPVRRAFQRVLTHAADGSRLAVGVWDAGELPRIWLYETNTGLIRPVTPTGEVCFAAAFSPDGAQIAYMKWDPKAPAIMVAEIDGTEQPRQVFAYDFDEFWITPSCWTPDGKGLLVGRGNRGGDSDILYLPIEGGDPIPLLASSASESSARLSPNGQMLAYMSNESGERHVYVRPYEGEGNTLGLSVRVSVEAGPSNLFWSSDGGRICFIDKHEHLLAVQVNTDPQLSVSKPETLLDVGELRTADKNLVPLPDGERFVFIQKGDEERDVEHLNVALDWFEELKKKVPTQVTQANRRGI